MRLIDADALKEYFSYSARLCEDIDKFPTIEERKKGKWIKISPANIYECSECGQNVMTRDIDVYKYCHGCGADMRGDDRENDRR